MTGAALALLLGLLAACVPVVPGATELQPLRPSAGLPFEIVAGQRAFVERRFSYADFGYPLADRDLRGFRFLSSSSQPPSNDVRSAFVLTEVVVPEGWSLALARATARRIPLGDGGMATAPDGVEYRLDMVFEVWVPVGAEPGSYRLGGLLRSRRGDDVRIGLEVRVR